MKIVVIGAGPAGLGCAYELTKAGRKTHRVRIIEKNSLIGGLSRTHEYKGFFFDVGPHRFFTKNKEVMVLWQELLGKEFIEVPRLTRILYKNKLFRYPVQLKDVVLNLGPVETTHCLLSYFSAKAFWRGKEPSTFEEWITKNFGRKLYETFFKTYTEKVWGIPCREIGAEWAAQRIKNLNIVEVVKKAIFGEKASNAKSLVERFHYPVNGAGQMYEKMAAKAKSRGANIEVNATVTRVFHGGGKIVGVEYEQGRKKKVGVDYLFSSMPLTEFIKKLEPKAPKDILRAVDMLYYRDHLTVNLIIQGKLFPDNWIYVHAPEVKMARVANYNNFSGRMAGKKRMTAISVEYFVFQNEDLWKMPDSDLQKLAVDELLKTGLIQNKKAVKDGFVIRETESYPTYYMGHKRHFEKIKKFVSKFKNLQLIGRGGMYKYNNMDHSIYTGMLAARNIVAGKRLYDTWSVNEDAEYLESTK